MKDASTLLVEPFFFWSLSLHLILNRALWLDGSFGNRFGDVCSRGGNYADVIIKTWSYKEEDPLMTSTNHIWQAGWPANMQMMVRAFYIWAFGWTSRARTRSPPQTNISRFTYVNCQPVELPVTLKFLTHFGVLVKLSFLVTNHQNIFMTKVTEIWLQQLLIELFMLLDKNTENSRIQWSLKTSGGDGCRCTI